MHGIKLYHFGMAYKIGLLGVGFIGRLSIYPARSAGFRRAKLDLFYIRPLCTLYVACTCTILFTRPNMSEWDEGFDLVIRATPPSFPGWVVSGCYPRRLGVGPGLNHVNSCIHDHPVLDFFDITNNIQQFLEV